MAKTKYVTLLTRLYEDDFPAFLPQTLPRNSEPAAPATTSVVHPSALFDVFRPYLAHFSSTLPFSKMTPLTRRMVDIAIHSPNNYVIFPEPAGVRCLLAVIDGRVSAISEDFEATQFEQSLPLTFSLLESYVDGGSVVICDVRVFEREDVSHLPFVVRASILGRISTSEAVRVRPFFRLRDARQLILSGFAKFPLRGFAIVEVNAELDARAPVCFLWGFQEPRPIVLLFVSFESRSVVGQVVAPTALVSMVTLEDLSESAFAMDGKAAEIRVVAPPRDQRIGLVRAQLIAPASSKDVWTHDQFMQAFPDFAPAMTTDELIKLFDPKVFPT
jgi:hypothetical protein